MAVFNRSAPFLFCHFSSQIIKLLETNVDVQVATKTPMAMAIANSQMAPLAKMRIPANEIIVVKEVLMVRDRVSFKEILMFSFRFLLGKASIFSRIRS